MNREIFTLFLPDFLQSEALAGSTAVVIDVLRAGTTICHALAAGAHAVVPCETVEEARRKAEQLAGEPVLLGGERNGIRIKGFHLDNSPFSYIPEKVAGKTIVFTTTNGTRALARCMAAEQIVWGTFNNLSAVVRFLREQTGPVHLVCAGTRGRLSAEDILFAGLTATLLTKHDAADLFDLRDDATAIAMDYYLLHAEKQIRQVLRESAGGRHVRDIGLEADIDRAAEIDRFDFVPLYSPQTGRITRDDMTFTATNATDKSQ